MCHHCYYLRHVTSVVFLFSCSVISCVCSVFFAFLVSFLCMCLCMYASFSPSTNLSGRHLRKVAFISSALGGSFLDAFAFTVACTCVQVTCTHTHHPHTHRHVHSREQTQQPSRVLGTHFHSTGTARGRVCEFYGYCIFSPPFVCCFLSRSSFTVEISYLNANLGHHRLLFQATI